MSSTGRPKVNFILNLNGLMRFNQVFSKIDLAECIGKVDAFATNKQTNHYSSML